MGKDTLLEYSDAYFLVGTFLRLLRAYLPFDAEVVQDMHGGWYLGRSPRGQRPLCGLFGKIIVVRFYPAAPTDSRMEDHLDEDLPAEPTLVCGTRELGAPDINGMETLHYKWLHEVTLKSENLLEALEMAKEWLLG